MRRFLVRLLLLSVAVCLWAVNLGKSGSHGKTPFCGPFFVAVHLGALQGFGASELDTFSSFVHAQLPSSPSEGGVFLLDSRPEFSTRDALLKKADESGASAVILVSAKKTNGEALFVAQIFVDPSACERASRVFGDEYVPIFTSILPVTGYGGSLAPQLDRRPIEWSEPVELKKVFSDLSNLRKEFIEWLLSQAESLGQGLVPIDW